MASVSHVHSLHDKKISEIDVSKRDVVETKGVENTQDIHESKDSTDGEHLSDVVDEIASNLTSRMVRGSPRGRVKRMVRKNEWFRWPKAIVPYSFDDDITNYNKREAIVTMRQFEKYTCLTFVPWKVNKTKEKYGLPDEGHIKFRNKGCASAVGNYHNSKGQGIGCCNRVFCLHELGHAIGFYHEHSNPKRHGWTRVNWKFVKPGAEGVFTATNPDESISYAFDITSKMHYSAWGFNTKSQPTLTVLFKELEGLLGMRENSYYFYMELAKTNKRTAEICVNFPHTCVNDGFVSVVRGKCKCMCPPGLDPDEHCSKVIKKAKTPDGWPKGKYALLSHSDGCPGPEFKNGTLTHWSKGNNVISQNHHVSGEFTKRFFKYNFCVKEEESAKQEKQAVWERGNYCILKKGTNCSEGFDEGYIQFDDKAATAGETNSKSGSLPEGHFGTNTKFEFCCRDDGYVHDPLILPNRKPFILFKKKAVNSYCQRVFGMFAVLKSFTYDNDNSEGLAGAGGSIPEGGSSFKLRLCEYFPVKKDCGGIIELTRENSTAEITSPNYPQEYDNLMECTWIIKGPKDSNVLLNFDTFDIARTSSSKCEDKLVIRYGLLGQNAFSYCGDHMHETIRSIYNTISLTMTTDLSGQKKGFKAKLKLVLPENHCFNYADNGRSYRGKVDLTRDLKPCLPWLEVTQCPYHKFQSPYKGLPNGDQESNLDGNYCRNPDNTFRPWCYTSINKAGLCNRDYCDVCNLENVYDTHKDCFAKQSTYCELDPPKLLGDCAYICNSTVPVSKDCPKLEAVAHGSFTSGLKDSYKEGETVEYKCKTGAQTYSKRCLGDGAWTPKGYVCQDTCSEGWTLHKNVCYKLFEEKLTYVQAEKRCKENSATVTTMKDNDERDFVQSLRKSQVIWIGATDTAEEGKWVWPDGTNVTWFNWYFPNNNKKNHDCAALYPWSHGNTWFFRQCDDQKTLNKFVCKQTGEVVFDKANECPKLKHLCNKNPKDVLTTCAHTCNMTKPAVEVPQKCKKPEEIADGSFTTGLKDSYKAGDTVVYKCKTSAETLTRRCLSYGSWSPGGYVCGVSCPMGWTLHEGACYKFFKEKKTFVQAEQTCKENAATVTSMKTEDERKFVQSFRNGKSIWIGATDRKDEGKWVWPDGTNVTSFNWYFPNNNREDRDCAAMYPSSHGNTWFFRRCDHQNTHYAFVCKFHLERKHCADRFHNCAELIMKNPTACTKYSDFAKIECPKTCSVCKS